MTVKHICPDCGLTLTSRIFGRSIDSRCPDCRPSTWPDMDLVTFLSDADTASKSEGSVDGE